MGTAYGAQGQYEKAVEVTKQAVRLAPERVGVYGGLANHTLALQRFDETRQANPRRPKGKNWIISSSTMLFTLLLFLARIQRRWPVEQQWFAGKPEENFGLSMASDTEAYGGHLSKARELTKRAVDSAVRADSKENGAIWQAIAGQRGGCPGDPAVRGNQRQRP